MAYGGILGQKTTVLSGTATIPISGWTNNTSTTGYYTISVTVNGVMATDDPTVGIDKSFTDSAADELMQEAWNLINGGSAAANALQFYATEVPTTAISIQWKVVR